ncbi:MAG TPA: hypothetical protein VGX25_03960 [Actinophytocola sp.]|uniref:hypothetical protein n=1 Tax=Actinophytocola sp. TaxID=1872138 RepID=UPI002DDC94CD|nr:hypothetical protein [Actinophytocola sp.]HEV2778533.1 hypothetical protein [Actinophytocola sp.]
MSDQPVERKLRHLRAKLDRFQAMAAAVERVLVAERDDHRGLYDRTGDAYHRGRHDACRLAVSQLHHLTNGEFGVPLDDQPELAKVDAKVST